MKVNELMVADLVMASTFDEEVDDEVFHPARIRAISSIQELFDGNWSIEWLDDCDSESCADLEPIPLTEEILKANGFVLDVPYNRYKISNTNSFIMVEFIYDNVDEKPYDDSYVVFGYCKCSYVHELQHALRLCGLNDLADNFKIK